MCQVANNMDKALEAMEKAQPVEKVQPTGSAPAPAATTQQIVIIPSYSMRTIIFLSVLAIVIIALFPVVVVRLALASSELNPFGLHGGHNSTNQADHHTFLASE
ncbi:hypothetical protein ONE63_001800 [Megalurothrips usitatus]|uniref:Uncharacterized protein n=1 Tax=Megalurothrips usitatus TaxID=439358 RepID=A0AAV7XDI2_9NEOP|nr:hypothetical protein ONE63_001800 [Megalurothrips usitatus]